MACSLLAVSSLLTNVGFASEPFIGQVKWFAGNFAPRGYAFCDGQLLPIAQNQALFSILGTTYGGDGRTSFALPDLRGRIPMHAGAAPGLTPRTLGEKGGQEEVTLNTTEMPSHNHIANGSSATGSSNLVDDRALAGIRRGYNSAADTAMDSSVVSNTGGSQSHNNMPPYSNIKCIIALVGLYPPRN